MSLSRRFAATLFSALAGFSSCKKETDVQLKEVVKQASWLEVDGLSGSERIILSTCSSRISLPASLPGAGLAE